MKSNNKNMPRILLPLIFIIMLLPLTHVEGAMNDYCAIPPFLSQSIPPNVLVVLDNSGSMCSQAYAGSYDPSTFANGLYYGYFDGTKRYKYTGNNRWEETADPLINGTVANPIATGSFLNWATMRRVEVAKKLLIGGKANPRSPAGAVTVKLNGETGGDCALYWNFQKDFDTSAGDLIYPFVGNYRFTRNNGDDLTISPVTGGTNTFYTYPTSDISVPAGWSEYPTGGAVTAWDKVDETTPDGNTTYIQNSSTTSPVMLGFSYTQAEPAGVITVTVQVTARRTATATRRIRGVIRIDGVNYESNTSNLTNSYATYDFTWATNPATSAPWTWAQIKGTAVQWNLQSFGVRADGNYATAFPRVTRARLTVSVTVPSGGPYNTIVDQGMVKAEGLLDTLSNDVRFGLAYYAGAGGDNGGRIDTYVGFGMATNMITSIHNMTPDTWTPLAETLYEAVRYFRQDAPYYSNTPADYQVGAGGASIIRDPYWYKFTDLDNTLTDMYVPCAKSFILFLTDGESTQDQNIPGTGSGACSLTNIRGCSSGYRFAGTAVGTTYLNNGTDYMIDVAFWARTNDMRTGACTTVPTSYQQCLPETQNVTIYPVFMFGVGSTLLKDVAIDGGFNDMTNDALSIPKNNRPDCITIPAECYRDTDGDLVTESNGDDDPLTYYEGDDGYALEDSIRKAIDAILKRASSGTAASVLASGEGSGANLLQALFYPKKIFGSNEIEWTGSIKNLWYYMDPFFASSIIMDDYTGGGTPDKILNTFNDCSITFTTVDNTVKAIQKCGAISLTIDVDDISVLWEAGKLLHSRTPATRTIYTTTDGAARTTFTTPANPTMQTLLQASGNQNMADRIISYMRGTDYNSKFCSSTVATACTLDADCPGGETCINYRNRTVTSDGTTNTWKLGDIISSTPKIVAWTPLNTYYKTYSDQSYKTFTESPTNGYKDRGMVFAGANDGMLHAFYLGKLELEWTGQSINVQKAKLSDPLNIGRGKEVWAFIPKNALPYLKYMADTNYCHIYSIDATPYILDASVGTQGAGDISTNDRPSDGSTWRTILIGGMRLGGACKNAASTYGVLIPAAGSGYSSYFALDITESLAHPEDPVNYPPQLLWEFSDPTLGFATTGPAVVRIGDDAKNGKWFVVFGSGPTGPIDTTARQFKGFSDQPLKLFVFDLKQGPGTNNVNVTTITPGTAINYAFAGSLWGSPLDIDQNNPAATGYYQDDALYFGFTQAETEPPTSATRWTKGGVLRLLTKEDPNPSNWVLSKVMDNLGPVTAEVAKLQNYKSGYEALWLYFGTGRYYYKTSADIDDATNLRRLYGVKEPCFSASGFNLTCTSTVSEGSLGAATTGAGSTDPQGWYIPLEAATSTYKAERVIAAPSASSIGMVFFPTAKPSADICSYGGATHLWAIDFDTGGKVNPELLIGKALMQVSSGSIEQIDLKTAFTAAGGADQGDRRTAVIQGLAVAPPPIVVPPKAVKRTIHMRER